MKKTPQNLDVKDLRASPTYQNLYKAIYGSPTSQKSVKLFSGNKDADFEILQRLDDKDLSQFCLVNTYVNNLCRDENFWRNRVLLKWGFLLGNSVDIVKNYKPAEIPWKDYYVWVASAIDSDPFFTYLYADALGRTDVTNILEYEFPEYFSDINEIFEIDEELKQQLRSTKFLRKIRHWLDYAEFEPVTHFRIPDHIGKKNLLYIIGLAIIGRNQSRMMVKTMHPQDKVGDKYILGTRPMYILGNVYIEPLELLQYFNSKLHRFNDYDEDFKNANEIHLKALREYFLEHGVDLQHSYSEEKLIRKLKGFGVFGLGMLTLYLFSLAVNKIAEK